MGGYVVYTKISLKANILILTNNMTLLLTAIFKFVVKENVAECENKSVKLETFLFNMGESTSNNDIMFRYSIILRSTTADWKYTNFVIHYYTSRTSVICLGGH